MPPSRIVVSDASVIFDLAKARLIEATLALPFEFVILDAIFDKELTSLATYSAADLVRLGFAIGTLDGAEIKMAIKHYSVHATRLSFNDCLALTYAEARSCILLTGDGPLRSVAENAKIEVQGFLWVAKLMSKHKTCPNSRIITALQALREHPSVRLPTADLAALLTLLKTAG